MKLYGVVCVDKVKRWMENLARRVNLKRWFACLLPLILSLIASIVQYVQHYKPLRETLAVYEKTRPPIYYLLSGLIIFLEVWPFLSIVGIVSAVLYLLFHREPRWSGIDRKTLGVLLYDLSHTAADSEDGTAGVFQQFDSACDCIDLLERSPEKLPEASKMALESLSPGEKKQFAFAFDGKNDRKDLLNILKRKRAYLFPVLLDLLSEIEEWRRKNDEKSLPPADGGRGEEAEEAPEAAVQKQTPAWAKVIRTMGKFGAEVRLLRTTTGPSIVRYELLLENTVKFSKITGMADDIALALGVRKVRIAALPGQESVIGVEAPNPEPVTVSLTAILESKGFQRRKDRTAFALGKDVSGKTVICSLAKLPHVLIAGTTGSGKSVCLNCLILSLIRSTPEQIRLILIDPKMVELASYGGLPHLMVPVVTDPKQASAALQSAVEEMMRRYQLFAEHGVKSLDEYNRLRQSEPCPRLIVVIDELSDLMIAAAKKVEEAIVRIAQMGRAAGVHLVIATQRPSADVITGLIKSNIPSRIAFAVPSNVDSRIILDASGAEDLIGRGDMLYVPAGEAPVRVQGCYVSREEIAQIVAAVKARSAADESGAADESKESGADEQAGEAL